MNSKHKGGKRTWSTRHREAIVALMLNRRWDRITHHHLNGWLYETNGFGVVVNTMKCVIRPGMWIKLLVA